MAGATSDAMLRPRGFSLLELLGVIGIVSVLLSILLPTVRVAKQISQRTQCASQLRQLGLAIQMYASQNQGWLPSWRHSAEVPGWCGKLASVLPADSPVYHCPSFPGRAINYFICAKWSAVNRRFSTKFSDVTMGSRFVIGGDMTQPRKYLPPYGTMEYSDRPSNFNNPNDAFVPCVCFLEDGGFLMHHGGNNLLFDDLHVDCFAHFDGKRMTFHPQRMLSWDGVSTAGPDAH